MVPGLQQRAFRRFFTAVVALLILLCVGSAGYHLLEGMSPVDAFYMTVITFSTVGFGEVQPLSPVGRIFTVGLIVAGGGLAAYTLSSVAEYLLSGEWRAHLEAQRRLRMLKELSNHVIVCGYGRVGRHVAHELRGEGITAVVIDMDPSAIAQVEAAGFIGVLGDGADEHQLREAGIAQAQGLVAAANSDAENVFIVLTARTLRPDLIIVARSNQEESEHKLLKAGANRVISPYRLSGRRMAATIVRPDVADFLEEVAHRSGLELLIEQVRLMAHSPLVGQRLADAQLSSRLGVTVLACKSDDGQWNTQPGADTVLQANTHLIALGTPEQLQALIKLARGENSSGEPRATIT